MAMKKNEVIKVTSIKDCNCRFCDKIIVKNELHYQTWMAKQVNGVHIHKNCYDEFYDGKLNTIKGKQLEALDNVGNTDRCISHILTIVTSSKELFLALTEYPMLNFDKIEGKFVASAYFENNYHTSRIAKKALGKYHANVFVNDTLVNDMVTFKKLTDKLA